MDVRLGRSSFATGGAVRGAGTATSDSIPAYLSNGEYVVRSAAVAKYGVAMFDRLNAMHFAQGGSVGAAAGVGIDYDRLGLAVAQNARQLYGDVFISGDPTVWRRQMQEDARAASVGGLRGA